MHTFEIELLQMALGRREALSRALTQDDWDAVFKSACDHSVIGILWAGVAKVPEAQRPYRKLLLKWFGQLDFIRSKNEKANKDCETITKLFRDAGFRTCIMKGQGNAVLYGSLADLRTAGDIDVWVDGGFEKVNAFVQKVAPTNEINELEIQLRGLCQTPVEVHYRPFIMRNPWTNRKLQKFFRGEADECFNNGLYTTIKFNLIHQLAHIRLHLFTEGIGLKQLIDYYFLLMNSREDKDEIMRIVDDLGLKNFAMAVMWVMKEMFLVPETYLLCETDSEGGKLLFEDVMKNGNFGHSNEGLQQQKLNKSYGLWALFVRNIRYHRFDKWDWICGPMWRIYHKFWRRINGYK